MSETLIAIIVFGALFAICVLGLAAATRSSERLDHARSRTPQRGGAAFIQRDPERVDR